VRTALGQNGEISGLVITHTTLLAARGEHGLGEWLKRHCNFLQFPSRLRYALTKASS
jgi:hypothetical protein